MMRRSVQRLLRGLIQFISVLFLFLGGLGAVMTLPIIVIGIRGAESVQQGLVIVIAALLDGLLFSLLFLAGWKLYRRFGKQQESSKAAMTKQDMSNLSVGKAAEEPSRRAGSVKSTPAAVQKPAAAVRKPAPSVQEPSAQEPSAQEQEPGPEVLWYRETESGKRGDLISLPYAFYMLYSELTEEGFPFLDGEGCPVLYREKGDAEAAVLDAGEAGIRGLFVKRMTRDEYRRMAPMLCACDVRRVFYASESDNGQYLIQEVDAPDYVNADLLSELVRCAQYRSSDAGDATDAEMKRRISEKLSEAVFLVPAEYAPSETRENSEIRENGGELKATETMHVQEKSKASRSLYILPDAQGVLRRLNSGPKNESRERNFYGGENVFRREDGCLKNLEFYNLINGEDGTKVLPVFTDFRLLKNFFADTEVAAMTLRELDDVLRSHADELTDVIINPGSIDLYMKEYKI